MIKSAVIVSFKKQRRGKSKNAKIQSLCDKICKFFKIFSQNLVKIQLKKAIIYKSVLENLKKDKFCKQIMQMLCVILTQRF